MKISEGQVNNLAYVLAQILLTSESAVPFSVTSQLKSNSPIESTTSKGTAFTYKMESENALLHCKQN